MNKETLEKSKALFAKVEQAEQILKEIRSPERYRVNMAGTDFSKNDERPGIAMAAKTCFRIMEMAWADEHERLQKEFNELKP